jgi:fatty acid-binding protein DegV
VEVVTESCKGGEGAHLCVLQVEADPKGEAQALVEELKSKVPVLHIPIYELPPAIIVHAGPKAMGIVFYRMISNGIIFGRIA